ncbi:MAG TPA: sigma-70 family RNA polymerase sigma factor [Gemmatimonadaceae bacterium]
MVSNLPLLNRILGMVARRHHLSGADAEDFASWATLRIVADDFAVLAKFRGESSLSTYLTSVATSLLRDYRHAVDGRWRSSVAALRLGELGVRLEQLLVRDEIPLRQAGELLRTAGVTTLRDRELAAIASTFPRRDRLRPVQYTSDVEACAGASGRLIASESDDDADDETSRKGLMRALASLPRDEQRVVELVFWKRFSVADVARSLGIPQKPLYRRLDRILKQLRDTMEQQNEVGGVRTRRSASLQ